MDERQIAINFIKTLSKDDREKAKRMLFHGVIVGTDFARENGVEPARLAEELKLIFGGK